MPIKINRVDGGVSIMYLGENADAESEVQKWKDFHVGEYVSHSEISLAEVPKDRSKRDAWKHDLTLDPAKAKAIDDKQEDEAIKEKLLSDMVAAEKAKKK